MPEHAPRLSPEVRRRLAARAARASRIRRRVIASGLSTFVLAFGVIAGTGSLGSTSSPAVASVHRTSSSAATVDSTATDSTTSDSTTSDSTSSDDTNSDMADQTSASSSQSSDSVSPVTTSQS